MNVKGTSSSFTRCFTGYVPAESVGLSVERFVLGTFKTSLYDFHQEFGGSLVPFAGYELPVLYSGENGGVMKEHLWCRSEGKASLFDVSHMGQVRIFFFGFLLVRHLLLIQPRLHFCLYFSCHSQGVATNPIWSSERVEDYHCRLPHRPDDPPHLWYG